jgi:hypothetical protein
MEYLNSVCVRPLYFMNNISSSELCGSLEGLKWGLIFTCIIGFIGFYMNNKYHLNISPKNFFVYLLFISLFIITICTVFFLFQYRSKFIGYKGMIDEMSRDGISKYDIYSKIQGMISNTGASEGGLPPNYIVPFLSKKENEKSKESS